MKRLIVVAGIALTTLAGPVAAHAYPQGGCAAPQNWPAGSAENYQKLCGVSLSDALAQRSTTSPKAASSGTAVPAAAAASVVGLGAGLMLRRRHMIQER